MGPAGVPEESPEAGVRLQFGPAPPLVYVAMFGATLAGQALGMVLSAIALDGRRALWLPIACSVVLEAIVGARFGAARAGRALSARECARLSAYYSLLLAGLSLPLWLWTLAARMAADRSAATPAHFAPSALVPGLVVFLVLLVAALPRQALMVAFSKGRA
jgi:hypothetical protein